MKLQSPLIITPRLLPGVKIGSDSFISVEVVGYTRDGRERYQYSIDTPEFEHTDSDLSSGSGLGKGEQDGLQSLLMFLGAAAESYRYERATGRESGNHDLFPGHVREWAYEHSDEIDMLALELEEQELVSEAESE